MLGNGHNSCIVVYNAYKDGSGFKLKQEWSLSARDSPSPPGISASEVKDKSVEQESSIQSESAAIDSGRNYPYEEAFYMAEFNPTGRMFAVKEVPYTTTLLYRISTDGAIEKMVDLMALIGMKNCSKRPVNTIFISAYCNGLYAIGVEGGYIALIDAELLQVDKVFKVVCGLRWLLAD